MFPSPCFHAQGFGIHASSDSQMSLGKFQIHHAGRCGLCDFTSRARRFLLHRRFHHANRQQPRRLAVRAFQQPLPIQPAPGKHLVGIQPMRPRHTGHRRPRLQRLLDHPPLLFDAAKTSPLRLPATPVYRLLRSVHLAPKWTQPICPRRAYLRQLNITRHHGPRRTLTMVPIQQPKLLCSTHYGVI